ncbi:MAG: hypothetical protein CMO01_27570 [Thalassobius sp.]|nr:hypothetical protein [Thalassovita sp.]
MKAWLSLFGVLLLFTLSTCQNEFDQIESELNPNTVNQSLSRKKKTSKTFVLIHGAWHPESVWDKVSDSLEQFGHNTITVQLPGLGNDTTALASINLQTHVDAVISAINSQSENVILVGHSYGGVVISQVGELIPSKIERLVYVSAFMLESGESLLQLALQDTLSFVTQHVVPNYPEITVPDEYLIEAFYNYSLQNNNQPLQQEIDALLPLIKPHPMQTFLDTVSLGSNYTSLAKSYVTCPDDQAITSDVQEFMYSRFPETDVHTINNSDHSPFITRPNQLANFLKHL